jgi:Uma2 family endonuclease
MTAEAFIAWAAEQPAGRYELAGGEVVAMAPERAGHTRAKLAAAIALRAAIGVRGRDCEAMVDGMVVRIDEATVYEPDALVRCGPRLPDEATEIADPVIVVEVISPSSRGIDSGAKLVGYFRIPSVRHYLVLDTEARAVVHHRRGDRGGIETRILRDGGLALDPPGIEIALADLFAAG